MVYCGFTVGLRLFLGEEEKIKEVDIAEAPFSLLEQPDPARLKTLDVSYKFSASECMDSHIRCHFLSHNDDITQLVDEVYEASTAVVAVIFVNVSNSLFLSEGFLAPDFQIHIPLYILSQEDGDYVSKNIDSITECRIMPERAEASEINHTNLREMSRMLTKPGKNHLLLYHYNDINFLGK